MKPEQLEKMVKDGDAKREYEAGGGNYEYHSHSHCWDQASLVPACGIPKSFHHKCCLCPKKLEITELARKALDCEHEWEDYLNGDEWWKYCKKCGSTLLPDGQIVAPTGYTGGQEE